MSKRVLKRIRRENQRNAWELSSGEWFEQLTFQSLDAIQNYFQTTYLHTYNQPTNKQTKPHEVEVFLRSQWPLCLLVTNFCTFQWNIKFRRAYCSFQLTWAIRMPVRRLMVPCGWTRWSLDRILPTSDVRVARTSTLYMERKEKSALPHKYIFTIFFSDQAVTAVQVSVVSLRHLKVLSEYICKARSTFQFKSTIFLPDSLNLYHVSPACGLLLLLWSFFISS